MTEEEIITVVDHKKRGGRIESHLGYQGGEWGECKNPDWDFSKERYRIHPEEQAIISHFNNGGEVEFRDKENEDKWRVTPVSPTEYWWKYNKFRIKPKEDEWHCNVCGKLNTGDSPYCKWRDEHKYSVKNMATVWDKDNTKTYIDGVEQIEVPEKWGLKGRGISIDESMRVYQDVDNEIIDCMKKIIERMN